MPFKGQLVRRVVARNVHRSVGGRQGTVRYAANRTNIVVPRRPTKLRTRTATKTKLTQKVKTSKDNTVSDSFFTHNMKGFNLSKDVKRMAAPFMNVDNLCTGITWNSGTQAIGATSYCNVDQLTKVYTSWAASSNSIADAAKTAKFYLKSIRAEALFTNQTNDIVSMTLYDVVARRDLKNATYNTPSAAWNTGAADSNNATAYSIIGSTPFQTVGFTEFWKVLKVTKVDLHSGGHHRHLVKINPRKMLSNEVLQEIGTGSSYAMGGLTHYTLVVCHGFPDNTTDKATASTASGKILWVTKTQYECYALANNKNFVYTNNTLTTLATESIINDLTGATVAVTTA